MLWKSGMAAGRLNEESVNLKDIETGADERADATHSP
jgi:hypothetical protein